MSNSIKSTLMAMFFTTLVSSCGGGSSSTPKSAPTPTPVPKTIQGVFTDSPVSQLSYTLSSGASGTTNVLGEFDYLVGDEISFSIGELKTPYITATDIITPFDFFESNNLHAQQLVNFLRLLQSLDDDGEYAQQITLSADKVNSLPVTISFDDLALSDDDFESLVGFTLVNRKVAQDHFDQVLKSSEIMDTDNDGIFNSADADNDNDGIVDTEDAFPWDELETADFDNDGYGDNADLDDDNDGIDDVDDSVTKIIKILGHNEKLPLADVLQLKESNTIVFTNKAAKQLYVMDLDSGDIQTTFTFDFMPEKLALSPDGKRLYVALLHQEHSAYWYTEDQSGSIAVIDLDSLSLEKIIDIDTDPYNIVITRNEKIIVSSGSGQWTNISAFDVNTGLKLGAVGSVYHLSSLILHPTQNLVYVIDSNWVKTLDISGASISQINNKSMSVGDKLWLSPDGSYFITGNGDVIKTSDFSVSFESIIPDANIKNVFFDEITNIITLLLFDNQIAVINASSFQVIKQFSVIGDLVYSYLTSRYGYYLSQFLDNDTGLVLIKENHPCLGCGSNTAPTAQFSYSPTEGETSDLITFDASQSNDQEEDSILFYRWDIDNDGIWETHFVNNAIFTHKYILAGAKYVRLQVKDSGGLTNTIIKSFDIAQGVDSGEAVSDSIAYQFDFSITAMAVDKTRGYSYISDKAAKKLFVVNLATGETEKYFDFEYMPESLFIQPETNRLFVALLTQEHSSYYWDEEQLGFIAIFDLEQQERIKTIIVNTDPYDLVVTKQGKLIVSSGSGQWTNIFAYDVASGLELGKAGIRQRSKISLHPDENLVFAADTDSSPSDIEQFDISGQGITSLGDSPYHGDYRMSGNVWTTPDGQYVITRGGDVFLASSMEYVKSLSETGITFEQIEFDDQRKLFFVVTSEGQVKYYSSVSYELVGTMDNFNNVNGVVVYQDLIFATTTDGQLLESLNPCSVCANNKAPTAAFEITSTSGDTTDTFVFDASASSDESDDLTDLLFRWDLNNDGAWDSDFLNAAVVNKKYTLSGSRTISLQVKDSGGLTHTVSKILTVDQGTDTGTLVTDSQTNVLDFSTTDATVDSARGFTYAVDKSAKKLFVINLTTGKTVKFFDFEFMPESVYLQPDTNKLYVTLLAHEHSSYRWEEEQFGYIAVFDIEQQIRIDTFKVTIDPFDIVVNSRSKVIISSGSGQWTKIHVYNGETGSFLGSAGIRQGSKISLHPDQNLVFAADTDSSPSDIEKFDISGTAILAKGDSPYHGDYRMQGNVWPTLDGDFVVTRGGDMFNVSDMTYVKSLTNSGTSITAIAHSTDGGFLYVIDSAGNVNKFNTSNYERVNASIEHPNAMLLLEYNNKIFIISDENIGNALSELLL